MARKQVVRILETGSIIDGKLVPDKNFKQHDMVMNSYKNFEDDDFLGIEYDQDQDLDVVSKNLKNLFINPVPKKLKFSKEIAEKLNFGSVEDLMNITAGDEAYLAAYSESEFLSFRYHAINGFYPDLLRIQSVKSRKFLKELFKYTKPPTKSHIKSFQDSRGNIEINTVIFAFKTDNKNDLILHLDDDEAMIFYNRLQEKDPDSMLHILIGLLKGCIEPKITKNKIYVVYQAQHGFEKIGFAVKRVNINIQENYNEGFDVISKEIIDGLNDKKKTHLVILSGEAGVGKTSFVRYLTSKLKKNIIFIPPDLVEQITNPSFIPFLMKNSNAVLIIEDGEPALQSRDGNSRTSAVSNMLNLTDGLLSDCLNISIVVTFNKDGKDIDKALLRKGRLLKNYKFEKLCVEKSKALLKKLGHEEVQVEDPMTLADIYFYDSDNNTKELTVKKRIGFQQ